MSVEKSLDIASRPLPSSSVHFSNFAEKVIKDYNETKDYQILAPKVFRVLSVKRLRVNCSTRILRKSNRLMNDRTSRLSMARMWVVRLGV